MNWLLADRMLTVVIGSHEHGTAALCDGAGNTATMVSFCVHLHS
jgi:hypothetical protein